MDPNTIGKEKELSHATHSRAGKATDLAYPPANPPNGPATPRSTNIQPIGFPGLAHTTRRPAAAKARNEALKAALNAAPSRTARLMVTASRARMTAPSATRTPDLVPQRE